MSIMETKVCSKCSIEKKISDFYKGRPECKECKKNISILNYNSNKTHYRLIQSHYWNNNKEKLKEKNLNYYYTNYDEIRKKQNEYRKNNLINERERVKNWSKNNREKINDYLNKKRKLDLVYKLKENVRRRINVFLFLNNITKNNKTFDIVGCNPQFLKEHIENQFIEGMSWDNYGFYGWHIDHIIPLSSAKTEEEIYKLCHYTNLQPLWAKDNLSKGNKI